MTVKFQISDKRGDAILVVSSEHDDVEAAHFQFAIAVQQAGLDKGYESFSAFPTQAVSVVAQALGATPVPQPRPAYQPAPAAPQPPAAAGRTCAHGPMTHRTGQNARGAWQGYFCPEPKGAPQCDPVFIR